MSTTESTITENVTSTLDTMRDRLSDLSNTQERMTQVFAAGVEMLGQLAIAVASVADALRKPEVSGPVKIPVAGPGRSR